ncbi:TPA: hypothetical protein DCX16_05670 [bacterium]|nr:hypothetical protein [bacterium]
MKIGVVSDSHKNLSYLRKALGYLKDFSVDMVIHLGDDYTDSVILGEYNIKNIRIPGVYDPEYMDNNIKNRIIERINELSILISHTKASHKNDQEGDIIPEEVINKKEADIVLYGHSHLYEIKKEGEIIYFNPGHLQEIGAKGRSATFGMLELKENEIIICSIFDLNKNCIIKEEFPCQRG